MIEGIGAKPIAHRLLSSAPFFVLALAAVFAEPSGQGNRDIFWAANTFFQKPLNATLGVVVIFAYFAAWWWTSLPQPNPRKMTQKALVAFHAELTNAQHQLGSASSEDDFKERTKELELALRQLNEWMVPNMSEAAWARLISPSRSASDFSYSGAGATDPNFYNHRNNVLGLNKARLGILEEMIKHDAWDK